MEPKSSRTKVVQLTNLANAKFCKKNFLSEVKRIHMKMVLLMFDEIITDLDLGAQNLTGKKVHC